MKDGAYGMPSRAALAFASRRADLSAFAHSLAMTDPTEEGCLDLGLPWAAR